MYIFVILAAIANIVSSYCGFVEENLRVLYLPGPMDAKAASVRCDMKVGSLASDDDVLKYVSSPWQYGCTHTVHGAFDPLLYAPGPVQYLEGEAGLPTPRNAMGFSLNRRKCRGQVGGAFCRICHKIMRKEVYYISGPFEPWNGPKLPEEFGPFQPWNRTAMEIPKEKVIRYQCYDHRGKLAIDEEVREMFNKPWTKGCSYVGVPRYSWTSLDEVQYMRNGTGGACAKGETAEAAFCKIQPDLNDASKYEVINIAIENNPLNFVFERKDAQQACQKKLVVHNGSLKRIGRLAYSVEVAEEFAEPWEKGCAFIKNSAHNNAPVRFNENGTTTTCNYKPVKAGAFCVIYELE